MPKAKSRAQARKFGAMYSRGEISHAELAERTEGIKHSELPERIGRRNPLAGTRKRGKK